MDAEGEVERLKRNIAALLRNVGRKRPCRGPSCTASIYMVEHLNGADTPYDEDGTNHFITCPDRDKFRKENRRATASTGNNPSAA